MSLSPGSTIPLLISEFAGAEFFDSPQEGGGVFAVGQEDVTNLFIFDETNDVAAGGDEVYIFMANVTITLWELKALISYSGVWVMTLSVVARAMT